MIKSFLYDASGPDREVDLGDFAPNLMNDKQILWIDITGNEREQLAEVANLTKIEPHAFDRLLKQDRHQHLDNYGDYFAFGVCAFTGADEAADESGLRPATILGFVVGQRWLITTHLKSVAFLEGFQAQDKGETKIGGLSPALLAVALLDWHLAEFFREVADIENAADDLDRQILNEGTKGGQLLEQIVVRRTHVSRLRAMIAEQRPVFYGLTRPDFTAEAERETARQLQQLAERFDRAVDEVERSREVVVGSFDLFTSMTTQKTNDLVKVLTFLTAVIGVCAAVAGILGMNFKAPLFETGMAGFVAAVGGIVLMAVGAVLVARWRRWL